MEEMLERTTEEMTEKSTEEVMPESPTANPEAESGKDAPATPPAPLSQEEKTFSQSDVNRIVNRRLAEERNKAEALFAQREGALARKELRLEAAGMLRQRKLPAALAALLDYENRERCAASLDAAEADFQAAVRDGVRQALRGLEPPKAGAAKRDSGATVRGAMGLK